MLKRKTLPTTTMVAVYLAALAPDAEAAAVALDRLLPLELGSVEIPSTKPHAAARSSLRTDSDHQGFRQ